MGEKTFILNKMFPTVSSVPYIDKKIDDEILSKIDATDKQMLNFLGRLYKTLSGENLNLDEVENAVDALKMYNAESEYTYLNNLLHPEKDKGVKIPSAIPVPSCAFQLHNTVTLSTNSSGNLAFVFNPFFLYDKANISTVNGVNNVIVQPNFCSSFWFNNDETLTGQAPNNNFNPLNIGQGIPSVYDQYRLVSASVVVRYIGRLDWVSGVIGGAIMFNDSRHIGENFTLTLENNPAISGTSNSTNDLAKYGNFDLAMDSFYHQENLSVEGLRQLYFPIDGSFEDYVKLWSAGLAGSGYNIAATESSITSTISVTSDEDYYKSGFNFFTYVMGAPANQNCFKVDIYCNYECLPNAEYLNYMPLSPPAPCISNAIKRESIGVAQKNALDKATNQAPIMGKMPSIWKKLKEKFGNSLPGIAKLVKSGLLAGIPALESGLALAGSLLNKTGMLLD